MSQFARVFIVLNPHYRALQLGIARRLHADHGSSIHVYCALEQQRPFWREALDAGVVASVDVDNHRYLGADATVEDPAAVVERARELERWLGTTIGRLAVTDRHLGRGYALAGFKHPRSVRSKNASYAQLLNGFSCQLEFWRTEFETRRPTLIVGGGAVHGLIARQFGTPVRTLAGSRYRDYHQWTHNEFFENPSVEAAFHDLADAPQAQIERPYDFHMTLRTKFLRDVGLRAVLARSADICARHAYWRLRGYDKARGYYPLEEVRWLWRRRRDLQRLGRMTRPLSSLGGQPFVYYPLHTEPELALQSLSPEYFYQHSSIAALSRDLPAGVLLAVKETYEAIGRRPTDFYAQLAEFKNVVILDSMELGLEVVRRARATATITGTGGFEAAVLGKPVITFGRHNQYNFLDHVSVIERETTLREALRRAVDDAAENERTRRDGARFLAATLAVSFDLSGLDHLNVEAVNDETIGLAYAALGDSTESARP